MKTRLLNFILCSVPALFLLSGCCKDEPVVIVPIPEAAPPSISGTISTNGQVPLQGATVTVSLNGKTYTATTDSKGQYSVEVPGEGTYTVKAEKSGYSSQSDEVITVSNVVSVWNAILPKNVVVSAQIIKGEETEIKVSIPPLVPMSSVEDSLMMKFSATSVGEDDSLIIVVEYRESVLERTKAGQMLSLLVVRYYLASGRELENPIDITVETPVRPDQVLLNGSEVPFTFDPVVGEMKISTKIQGTLVLNYRVNITEDMSGSVAVQFEQATYDNFYGSGPMHIVNPKYTLQTGGTVEGNWSLLNSVAANYTGVPARSSAQKEYSLDITLPVGGKLKLEGTQAIHKYDFSLVADGRLYSTVNVYGSAYITATTINKQHIGGSN